MIGPTVISQSKVPNEDTNVWKVGVLAVVFAACGLLVVTRMQAFMSVPGAGRAWLALAAFVAFGSVGILVSLMVKHKSVLATSALVACLLPVVGFASRFTGAEFPTVLVAGFAAYTVLVIRALLRSSQEVENSVKIRFFSIARTVLPRLTTAVLLFAAVLVYLNYAAWGGFTPELRESLARTGAAAADPVLRLWFPEASFSMTGTEFFRAVARQELMRLNPPTAGEVRGDVSEGFRALPPAAQERLTAEAALQIKKSFERFAGPLDGSLPMRDALAAAVERYVSGLPEGAVRLLGIALAILIFGTLKSAATLTYWVIEGLAFVIFKILVLAGFAKVSIEMRPHEFISVP